MIQSLYIRNYVLIDELEMNFSGGFTTITGETGAGKSILMGALSLILGQRADTLVLKLKDAKCIVEGTFHPGEAVRKVFERNDLDFEPVTILRREIAPGGKSRAFVNDTPVTLPLLREIGNHLVDIHSQHQSLQLNDHLYQLEVTDHLAGTGKELKEYREAYARYHQLSQELDRVKGKMVKLKEELDYMQFQFNELDAAHLKDGEMEILEADLQRAEHAEEIRSNLFHAASLLNGESSGILDQLKEALVHIQKISRYFTPAMDLASRTESAYIELKDITAELSDQAEKSEIEPGKLASLQERMDLLFSLMQKHRVREVGELIALREQLNQKIEELTFSDEKIGELEKERSGWLGIMERLSGVLHEKRSAAAEELQKKVEFQLRQLGIPNARFTVGIDRKNGFDQHGGDEIRFLFSANKQVPLEEISKVASGGEVSRLMLCIKSLVSDRKGMPTLIFDEIDAGVSGEIADKVGGIMNRLAQGRQVVAITHLPQVASMGADHFIVYKEDTDEATFTRIRKLRPEERVTEIARMLSGEEVTDAALSNARVLLRV